MRSKSDNSRSRWRGNKESLKSKSSNRWSSKDNKKRLLDRKRKIGSKKKLKHSNSLKRLKLRKFKRKWP